MTNYEKYKAYYKEYYNRNKKERCEYGKQYYNSNKEIISKKNSEWYQNHKETNLKRKNYREQLKQIILTHYGNNVLACVLCGHDRIASLSIDHIDGGGRAHRKLVKSNGGAGFYRWLKRNNYPEGFRTLCFNCQFEEREKMRAGAILQKTS